MKILVVEDDYITSRVLQEILLSFGDCDVAEDGKEALELFEEAHERGVPYDVIFLDIMMPELDGQETLNHIRDYETQENIKGLEGVKIVMTTALDDFENIKTAFKNQCEDYIVKPFDKDKITNSLIKLGFLS